MKLGEKIDAVCCVTFMVVVIMSAIDSVRFFFAGKIDHATYSIVVAIFVQMFINRILDKYSKG